MIEGLARDSDSTRYAGFWIRVFANVLDLLVLAVINQMALLARGLWFGTSPALEVACGWSGPGMGSVWVTLGTTAIVVGGIMPPLVIIGSWIAFGASPGKMLLRLRIVDEPTGGRPSVWQCIGRYFMALIAILCAGIGYFWIGIDLRKQGWHDKIVRTLVIREARRL
jgi:uncharacterized RDD family membrane protein YckC